MGSQLNENDSNQVKQTVRDNRDSFAWKASDMPGIDPKFLCHRLAIYAYSGYNQIRIHPADEEKTTFITESANFCYKVMSFGLKNAGATYHRLMDKVFQGQIGRNIEIYVDDMVVKSNSLAEHLADLVKIFHELRKHNMRLNPDNCTFGVKGGKFLGFMLLARGIKANRDKCQAVLDMRSPSNLKELQHLAGRLVALSQFLPRPDASNPLLIYLAISDEAINSVLVQEKEGAQAPVYFINRLLQESETRYQLIEKVALRLVHTSRCLRHYFQSHQVVVHTDCPISKVLGKPELAGRMMAWSVELSQFDISYKLRGPIKAQCLADFINEDGSLNYRGSGAGVILEGPKGIVLEQSLRFRFKASNNQAEYEALLAGLRLAEDMGASRIKCLPTPSLWSSRLKANFQEVIVEHIPREDNTRADQLARLAATKKPGQLRTIIQQEIDHPSVEEQVIASVSAELPEKSDSSDWRDKIKAGSTSIGVAPTNPTEAKRLRTQASRYVIIAGLLYKLCDERGTRRHLWNALRSEVNCQQTLRAGYYWPTMNTDCATFIKKCQPCQKYADLIQRPAEQLHCIPLAWLFATWGADILGPFPVAKGQCKFLIVAMDLFTKWIEAEPLAWEAKGAWTKQLPEVLWAYRCTPQSTTRETPFRLVYGSDAMIPVEIGEPSFRRVHYDESNNEAELRVNLDELEDVQDRTQIIAEATKQRYKRRFDSKVKPKEFREGDLVWRATGEARKDPR
uniref:Retrovirus-related Pol polyprotein from transposon 17.6 n=1 Tax=Cajanus cajan TaxID=3821 RepID=A0A151SWJ8_CAJCA|nr:Retrovirus-related Pol polyprotein from transposon 17.6 [Cajanus cajan]